MLTCRVCKQTLINGECPACNHELDKMAADYRGEYDIPLKVPVGDCSRALAAMALERALRTYKRENAFVAWREWFAKNCSEWNDIEDIEAELGRDEED